MNLAKVTLAGRVGRDAEMKFLSDGTALAEFSLATEAGRGQNKETIWWNCKLFGKRAESLTEHVTKGKSVLVCGRVEQRSWEKDGQKHSRLEVVVEDFEFGGEKRE